MIRVVIPYHLRTLAGVSGEVSVELDADVPATIGAVLDAVEAKYPMLRGTIRDHGTLQRRAFVRYFVAEQDWSLKPGDSPLPESVARGTEPFIVLGSIAGG